MTAIQDYISTKHLQQVTDIHGAIRMYLREPNNSIWKEMAMCSIGEAILGPRSSGEDRYKAGIAENLNKWLNATACEIQKRVA